MFKNEKSKLFVFKILKHPYNDTAANVGIDKRKDIFAASYLL